MQKSVNIQFKNVCFSYGSKEILKDVNFSVESGCFISIIGGSGSGKTTLLKLISGQLIPNSGAVLIDGKSLDTFSQQELYYYRKNMGYLFQQGALFTDLTVAENVAFPLIEHTSLSAAKRQEIVAEKLQSVALLAEGSLFPAELSGGMVKRVALARAIVLNPNLLLYDEPFAGLDPISLKMISQLITYINQSLNSTSIMVTHNIKESLLLADSIVFLANKTVVYFGSVENILECELDVVRQFLLAASILE